MARLLSLVPTVLSIVVITTTFNNHAAPLEAHAFSTAASGDIKIVGLPGGQIQSLPGMYVKTFRRWIVETNNNSIDNNNNVDSTKSEQCTTSSNYANTLTIEPIQGAGLTDLPYSEGWVNPTTTNELWWPEDLDTLQSRPMLNVLFTSGVLSYVGVGLDIRVPHCPSSSSSETSDNDNNSNNDNNNNSSSKDNNIVSWRNYGMNSQPISRIWTSFDIAMEKLFHVEGFILRKNTSAEGKSQESHEILFPSMDVQSVLQRVATFIGELDSLSPIGEGFHIVSFPMTDVWMDLPDPREEGEESNSSGGGSSSGSGSDGKGATYKIVCMGTSEPFATKLLDMDEDLLTMSSTSVLEVEVSRTAKGGDSPYLPEPYKELYVR